MVEHEASEEKLGVDGQKEEEIGVGVDVDANVDGGGDKGTIDLRRGKE